MPHLFVNLTCNVTVEKKNLEVTLLAFFNTVTALIALFFDFALKRLFFDFFVPKK